MAIKERKMFDIRSGNQDPESKITVRYDTDDTVLLPCFCNYDPTLHKQVHILRRVEKLEPDGTWTIYPSVIWLDGVFDEDQLQTLALVKKNGESGIFIMSSTDGVPDGELMSAAEKAGIHTETIN
ncbi:MAG: hypothetical protein M1429_01930 [Patescibacteria group bacterium]|nr:hypothetical protein [Patescibacteria group bacterium]